MIVECFLLFLNIGWHQVVILASYNHNGSTLQIAADGEVYGFLHLGLLYESLPILVGVLHVVVARTVRSAFHQTHSFDSIRVHDMHQVSHVGSA